MQAELRNDQGLSGNRSLHSSCYSTLPPEEQAQ